MYSRVWEYGHSSTNSSRGRSPFRPSQRVIARGPLEKDKGDKFQENLIVSGPVPGASLDEVRAKAEADYGVPAPVITAFWAMETDFGAVQGDFNTRDALVTLSHDCRRPELFRPQLLALIKMVQHADLDPATNTGAWAGEIGMVQMLPKDIIATPPAIAFTVATAKFQGRVTVLYERGLDLYAVELRRDGTAYRLNSPIGGTGGSYVVLRAPAGQGLPALASSHIAPAELERLTGLRCAVVLAILTRPEAALFALLLPLNTRALLVSVPGVCAPLALPNCSENSK